MSLNELAILAHLMKKKRARTKTKSLGSRLKKAVKRVLKKKSPPKRKTISKKSASLTVKLVRPVKSGKKAIEPPAPPPHDLPFSYGKTSLVLLVRDPEWAYAYWDFSAETWSWVQSVFKKNPGAATRLRIHNHTQGGFFDVDVHLEAKNWYICLGLDNTEFEAELGILDHTGKFLAICRSNRIKTPRIKPSDEIDPYWVPENFDELYRFSGGGTPGASSSAPAVKKPTS